MLEQYKQREAKFLEIIKKQNDKISSLTQKLRDRGDALDMALF
jgi:hypothetical protein